MKKGKLMSISNSKPKKWTLQFPGDTIDAPWAQSIDFQIIGALQTISEQLDYLIRQAPEPDIDPYSYPHNT